MAAEADVSRLLISAAVAAATRLYSAPAGGDAQSWGSHPAGESANSNFSGCVAQRVLLKLSKMKNFRMEKVPRDLVQIPANSPGWISPTVERCL